MKRHIALWFVAGIVAAGSYVSTDSRYGNSIREPENRLEAEMRKQAEEASVAEQTSEPEETAVESQTKEEPPAAIMSRKEKRAFDRKAAIAEERAKETSRFKKKAIRNTEAREKKYEEIMERKQQKASRFQKKAAEEELLEKERAITQENIPSRSRFTEKAKRRAEERAQKREEKSKNLRRNQ